MSEIKQIVRMEAPPIEERQAAWEEVDPATREVVAYWISERITIMRDIQSRQPHLPHFRQECQRSIDGAWAALSLLGFHEAKEPEYVPTAGLPAYEDDSEPVTVQLPCGQNGCWDGRWTGTLGMLRRQVLEDEALSCSHCKKSWDYEHLQAKWVRPKSVGEFPVGWVIPVPD